MRIFIAGASGVIGQRLIPLLVNDGHTVAAMTRSSAKTEMLRKLGAKPVVCDVYDPEPLNKAVKDFQPEAIIQQLTDLPDSMAQIPEYGNRNDRMRLEGTRNMLAAAKLAGAPKFFVQSIGWELPGEHNASVKQMEQMVRQAGGVVLSYGQFYGPDTYYESEKPEDPRIFIDDAAAKTVEALAAKSGQTIRIAE